MNAASDSHVIALLDNQYAATEDALAGDPKWQELTEAADREAAETPDRYFHRNMKSLYLETQMPPISSNRTKRRHWFD